MRTIRCMPIPTSRREKWLSALMLTSLLDYTVLFWISIVYLVS
jgi:hypothetical protein